MTEEMLELIECELEQRRVNRKLAKILIDICRQQVVGEINTGVPQVVVREEIPRAVVRKEIPRVVEIKAESYQEEDKTEVPQVGNESKLEVGEFLGVSKGLEERVGVSKGEGDNIDSMGNICMFGEMFGG
jgi:hypothetical protein